MSANIAYASRPASRAVSIGIIAADVIVQVGNGIAIGFLVGRRDNLDKMIGTVLSMIITTILQFAVFPKLRSDTLTGQGILGSGIIIISTYSYHHYKSRQPVAKVEDADVEQRPVHDMAGSSSNDDTMELEFHLRHLDEAGDQDPRRSTPAHDFAKVKGSEYSIEGETTTESSVKGAEDVVKTTSTSNHLPAPKAWWIIGFMVVCIICAGVVFWQNPPDFSYRSGTKSAQNSTNTDPV